MVLLLLILLPLLLFGVEICVVELNIFKLTIAMFPIFCIKLCLVPLHLNDVTQTHNFIKNQFLHFDISLFPVPFKYLCTTIHKSSTASQPLLKPQ